MPTGEQRKLQSVENNLAKVEKDLNKKNNEIKGLREQLDTALTLNGSLKKLAKDNEDTKNGVLKDMIQLREEVAKDAPVGAGAYSVRTKHEQPIFGVKRPAGSLLGFITPIEGIDPLVVIDALRYKTAGVAPTNELEAFNAFTGEIVNGELLKEALQQHAAADDRIGDLEGELKRAKASIDEANEHCSGLEDMIEELKAKDDEDGGEKEEPEKNQE